MRAVLERDFLAEASGSRAFRSRTYLGLMVALAVTIVMFVLRDQMRDAPDRVALYVFRAGAAVVVCMLAILAPAAVVGSVLNERAADTLPIVLASPVGTFGFAAAKFLARAGVVLSFGLAALLPLGFTVLLGGVGASEVGKFVALCAAVVIELSGWSLWISCHSRRPATAAVLSYLLPAGRWAACWIAGLALALARKPGAAWLLQSTPVPAFMDVTDPGVGSRLVTSYVTARSYAQGRPPPAVPLGAGGDALLFYGLFAVALAGLFLFLAARRLRLEAEPPRSRGSATPRPGKPRRMRVPPAGGNPVAWKEGRLLNTGTSRPMYYLLVIGMIAVELIYWRAHSFSLRPYRYNFYGSGEWGRFAEMQDLISLFGGYATAIALLCAVNAASSFSFERTQGTWDLLRASPLTAAQIARGKAAGVLRGAAVLSILPLLHLLVGWKSDRIQSPWTVVAGMLLIGVLALFWTVAGLRCGARAASPGRALFLAVLTFACFFVGLSMVAGLCGGYWSQRYVGPYPAEIAAAGNPWWTVTNPLTWIEYPHGIELDWRFGFRSDRMRILRDASWSLLWAVGLLVATRVLFSRLVRRLEDEGGAA